MTPRRTRLSISSRIGKLQLLHRGEECLRLQLDSLRKKLPRTRSQDIGQWIVNLVRLTQRDNIAILVHGVSLSSRGSGRLDTRLDTPPISPRHHPVSRITPALLIRTVLAHPHPQRQGFTVNSPSS